MGVIGGQPSRSASEWNERNSVISSPQGQPPCDSVFIPLPAKPRCERGNCLPVAVTCTSLCFICQPSAAGSISRANQEHHCGLGVHIHGLGHNHLVGFPYDTMLRSTHLACPTCQTWKQLCPSRPAASHGGGFSCPVPSPERAHWPLGGSGAPPSCRASPCLAQWPLTVLPFSTC